MTLTIFAYIIGSIILYLFLYLLYKPLKLLAKLAALSCLGAVSLMVSNFALGFFGLTVGINIITACLAGFLGIPGLALLYSLSLIL